MVLNSTQSKIAVLDTDFVSKTSLFRVEKKTLIDEIFEASGYRFACHKKVKDELGRSDSKEAVQWLEKTIRDGKIAFFDDSRILSELKQLPGNTRFSFYRDFLKESCSIHRADLYDQHFQNLDHLIESGCGDDEAFIRVLSECEKGIGDKRNYGEIKAGVLVKTLNLLTGPDACVFCSDDLMARKALAAAENVPCISVLSSFLLLREKGKPVEEVRPFFQRYEYFYMQLEKPQPNVRVLRDDGKIEYSKIMVPIEGILDEIYEGKYKAVRNGELVFESRDHSSA